MELRAQEVVLGASNKYTAEEQLDLVSLYWLSLHGGESAPLTVRIVSRTRDLYFDLCGGNRIPTITERKARSVAELRASEAGVKRVLLVHDGTQASHDLFEKVFTMLDEQVGLTVVQIPSGEARTNGQDLVRQAQEQAERLHRPVEFQRLDSDLGNGLVTLAAQGGYDLIIFGEPEAPGIDAEAPHEDWPATVRAAAPCPVLVAPSWLHLAVKDE
jgi:nucleotide-binding universal stress UspA family protein